MNSIRKTGILTEAKERARAEARVRREAAREALGEQIAPRLADMFFAHVPFPAPAILAGYMPIGGEADPGEIMRRARAGGHECALPCVETRNAPLTFRLWRPGEPLVAGPHGTRAPSGEAAAVEPGLMLVPLLAFDGAGRRLGYGGGYYDRTLEALRAKNTKCLAVGLAFAAQEAAELPEDEGDQRLDWIVTERGARAFAGRKRA